MDETLINIVQSLLGTQDILLCQCDTWGKIRVVMTFLIKVIMIKKFIYIYNNMFLHPSDWDNPEAVAAII